MLTFTVYFLFSRLGKSDITVCIFIRLIINKFFWYSMLSIIFFQTLFQDILDRLERIRLWLIVIVIYFIR
jgi:hypothetical protein